MKELESKSFYATIPDNKLAQNINMMRVVKLSDAQSIYEDLNKEWVDHHNKVVYELMHHRDRIRNHSKEKDKEIEKLKFNGYDDMQIDIANLKLELQEQDKEIEDFKQLAHDARLAEVAKDKRIKELEGLLSEWSRAEQSDTLNEVDIIDLLKRTEKSITK
jgi:hypothetical protein